MVVWRPVETGLWLMASSMFEHFSDLRSRNQAARYKVLQLLNELLQNHRKGEEILDWCTEYADISKLFEI
jgi:hypothetical protein